MNFSSTLNFEGLSIVIILVPRPGPTKQREMLRYFSFSILFSYEVDIQLSFFYLKKT